MSDAATIAVGGSGIENSSLASCRAAVRRCGPCLTYRRIEHDACVGEGAGGPLLAVATRHEPERVLLRLTDERDALMAERQEVLRRERPPRRSSISTLGNAGCAVSIRHRRKPGLGEAVAFIRSQREGDDDQSVELVPWNFHQSATGPIRCVDVVEHDLEAVRLQRLHDAAVAAGTRTARRRTAPARRRNPGASPYLLLTNGLDGSRAPHSPCAPWRASLDGPDDCR